MYNNNPYSYYGYQPNYNYQQPTYSYQQPKQDVPFSVVRFGTLDEAKGYVVSPAKAVMFIKSDFTEFYIKSADNMGNPSLEIFKCSKLDNNPQQTQTAEFNPKEFVKISDLNEFSKNFLTREDLKLFTDKINELKGDLNSGKQQQGLPETIS